MVKSKFTPEQKIQIVLESIRTSISTAELCRKHNVHPQTFHNWKQRFMESGKAGLSQSGKKDPIKTMKKREEGYKRLIGELTIANDILKNPVLSGTDSAGFIKRSILFPNFNKCT